MLSPIEKLIRFLQQETRRGYNNRAVVGGLDRFLPVWQKESAAESLPVDVIDQVNGFLQSYTGLDVAEREKTTSSMLELLAPMVAAKPTNEGMRSHSRLARVETREAKEPRPMREPRRPTPKQEQLENRASVENDGVRANLPSEEKYAPLERKSESQARPTPVAAPAPVDLTELALQERRNWQKRAKTGQDSVDSPVSIIPGIGGQNARSLAKQHIETVRDLLYYFPRRYDDYSKFKTISQLIPDERVTIIGVVRSIDNFTRGRYQITEAVISDGTGTMQVTWFNQPWIIHQIRPQIAYVFSGKVDCFLGRPVMNAPDYEPSDQDSLNTGRIVPIYHANANLKQNFIRRMLFNTVRFWADKVDEFLPSEILESADLLPLPKAIEQIHFPTSEAFLSIARRRIAFDEVFLYQLNILAQKQAWIDENANRFCVSDEQMGRWVENLPYQLTNAQWKVLNEIRGDIDSGHPMNRLIQGDVGSGKTIVALLAALTVANRSGQAVLMAPTGILAEQHYRSLVNLLEIARKGDEGLAIDVNRVALLTGATPESEKREVREKLLSGETLIVIGTHALIEEPVQFRNLELVVIDEQHRFGVEQRAMLRAKGTSPHLAVMTATPIPRSLALTVFGDLDLSVMDEMPAGRLPVETYVVDGLSRERAYKAVLREIRNGHQAFIIYPLVESGDEVQKEGKSAVEAAAYLQETIFPNQSIALLHGRMKGDEKDGILQAFKAGEYDILVSTSVIEVGVDIPNATIMLIEDADRFGLAQLHQFRGRVGRGDDQSYCILITDNQAENQRLSAMTQTNDGFELAEIDLKLRGPGDFLGTRQAGQLAFKMAAICDARLIEKARQEAEKVFELDPRLEQEAHQLMKIRAQEKIQNLIGDFS